MVDLNATIGFIAPYFSEVEELVGAISVLVGGIFGIYLIAVIIRVVMLRKMFKSYNEIKSQLRILESKIDAISKKKKK